MASSFKNRIGYFTICVIPAHLLSSGSVDASDPSSLREDASHDELSFVQVQRPQDTSTYWCRVAAWTGVAASLEHLTHGYTVLLSEDDLAYALPYDIRLQNQPAERILELLHAHAAAMRPAPARAPERHAVAVFEPDTTIGVFELPVADVAEQYARMSDGAHEQPGMQRVLLRAALLAVEQIIARGGQKVTEAVQVRAARLAVLCEVQQDTGARVVRSTMVRRGRREVWCVQFAKQVAA